MLEAVRNFLSIGWSIYVDAGFWVVVSLIAGGLLHTFVPQESFRKWLGKPTLPSIALATGIGVLLPVCSCGVVPLGMAMYWSGASLAATLAFMVATPIINPAAAFMAFGLLGPELAIIYIISGFCIPPFVAYASRFLAPDLQHAPGSRPVAAPAVPRKDNRSRSAASGLVNRIGQAATAGLAPMSLASGISAIPDVSGAAVRELPRLPGGTGCT